MNLLNKKIFLFGLIVVFLIIIIGIVLVFSWQNTDIPFDISEEAVKEKCIEDVNKMTSEELMNQIKVLKYPEEIDLITGEDRITSAYKGIINYFICKVGNTKNENDYNQAKDLISKLVIKDESKENSLNRLDNVYSRGAVEDSFTLSLALMDLDKICPDKIVNLCIDEIDQFPGEKEIYIEKCEDVCNKIDQYSKDKDKLKSEIIDNQIWINDELLYNQKQYRSRVAMVYRLEGQDLAMKVCDNINSSEKENCVGWINFLKQDENDKIEECNNIRKELEELICGY